jgi:hypothetical protein
MRRIAVALLCVLYLAGPLARFSFAQEGSATLTGFIQDSSKALIPGVKVTAIDTATNVRFEATTGKDGSYTIVSLPVGPYQLQVEKPGFKTILKDDLFLHTQDALQINFEMAVGSTAETVTVSGNNATNDSPAVSMTVDREFVENMPLNGQSFQDLIQLAPGTVMAAPGGAGSGYYSVDGQRTDSNNYTVDGISANLGGYVNDGQQGQPGNGLAGAVPAQTALGTTQSLVSIDSLQEFTIQTSGYSAEFGRSPGGQVQFTTRSGTDQLHGTLFDYFRNTALDANSWADGYYGIPQSAEHQNDFGGTVGGPLTIPHFYDGKGRTFYFLSYEGLRLLLPSSESEYVPTAAFRAWASPYVLPFLNTFPQPNPDSPGNQDGCTIPNPSNGSPVACDALFNVSYSYPNNLDNYSARIDQSFGKRFHAFARYADTPSSEVIGAEQTTPQVVNVHNWTIGLTTTISPTLLDEFRAGYSHDGEQSASNLRAFGGSTPYDKNLIVPSAYNSPFAEAVAYLYVPNSSLSGDYTYSDAATTQRQLEILDSLNWTRGTHSLKFGLDWRRMTPIWHATPYATYLEITQLSDMQDGNATLLETLAQAPGEPVFDNLSFYAQDHWRARPTFSLDYGIRWDFNPPPGPANGEYPAALTSDNLSTATLAPSGTAPYKTDYHSFGPRLGFSWNAVPTQHNALTLRGGFGIFFDTAQQAVGTAYASAYPFAAAGPAQSEVPFPLTSAELAPPSLTFPITAPYPSLQGIMSPDLTSPYTEEWSLSLDEALNKKNTLTASYVGNNGKKLLFLDQYLRIPGNTNFTSLEYTNNAAHSSYNALQVQDTGQIVTGLDLVSSFTWAHALDNASGDGLYPPIYGNSDNDIRRLLNIALNYQIPSSESGSWIHALTSGWTFANRFTAVSGTPMSVIERATFLLDGQESYFYPNLVAGVPIYLHGNTADVNGKPVPHSWRLNRAAFACSTTGATSGPCTGTPSAQGDLGRNYVRGPSFWALNTALQRDFPIYERMRGNFRVDAFNILNHANLNGIVSGLAASTFGESNGFQGTIGSPNALYAMGAPRSLQLSLKLQF